MFLSTTIFGMRATMWRIGCDCTEMWSYICEFLEVWLWMCEGMVV